MQVNRRISRQTQDRGRQRDLVVETIIVWREWIGRHGQIGQDRPLQTSAHRQLIAECFRDRVSCIDQQGYFVGFGIYESTIERRAVTKYAGTKIDLEQRLILDDSLESNQHAQRVSVHIVGHVASIDADIGNRVDEGVGAQPKCIET